MNKNYLVAPTLYKLGFIDSNTTLRHKQGLQGQKIATSCQQSKYDLENLVPGRGIGCSYSNMYPITPPQIDYGPGIIPDKCPCTRFLYS